MQSKIVRDLVKNFSPCPVDQLTIEQSDVVITL
jgi:hypothetical protein